MEKELFDYTAAKVEELLAAGSSAPETKQAAQDWKDAVAADGADVDAATNALLDKLDEEHTTVDGFIGFLQTDMAKEFMGEEGAAKMIAHEQERKERGAKFCDCDACKATHELLAKFGREEADLYI